MASNQIDLGWMRVLEEAVRRGSFTAAAQALGTTQPAVSYQMRRVEEQLGFEILRRRNTGVELTDEGRALYEIVVKTVSGIDEMVKRRSSAVRPSVRLRSDYGFPSFWLVPRMQDFRWQHPEIDIRVVAGPRESYADVDDADVTVVYGQAASFRGGLPLLPEQVAPVCSPRFAAENGPFADPAALARERLVHLDVDSGAPWLDWPGYFDALGFVRPKAVGRGDIGLNTYSLVIEAAIAGQGLALGWAGLMDGFVNSGMLVWAGKPVVIEGRGYILLPPKRRTPSNEALVSWLLSAARQPGF